MAICKLCRTENLQWKQIDGRWLLTHSNGEIHLCKSTRRVIASKIPPKEPKDRLAIGFNESGVKWIAEHQTVPVMPPDALLSFHHSWWSFLDQTDAVHTPNQVATQLELIP